MISVINHLHKAVESTIVLQNVVDFEKFSLYCKILMTFSASACIIIFISAAQFHLRKCCYEVLNYNIVKIASDGNSIIAVVKLV